MPDDRSTSRRDFLSGRSLQAQAEQAGELIADAVVEATQRIAPVGGDTVRLATNAMACEFSVFLNPGPSEQVMAASDALDHIHVLEDQLTVYRDHSEMSQINRRAAAEAVEVEPQLFALLLQSRNLCLATERAFDPTSGPLIAIWRECRRDGRIPTDDEITARLQLTGIEQVEFDESAQSVRYQRAGVELNLGSIGKGYALDRAANHLVEQGVGNWLFHGGHSSVLARGDHNKQGGWPIGIRNPLFPTQLLATILMQNNAMSTSGSGVQYFRHDGKRYGHILDPRTGWPVDDVLSVTVLAPTAAEADALSTAFFVLGLEKTRAYCDNHRGVAALVIPPPRQGRRLEAINCGIPDELLTFAPQEPTTTAAALNPPD